MARPYPMSSAFKWPLCLPGAEKCLLNVCVWGKEGVSDPVLGQQAVAEPLMPESTLSTTKYFSEELSFSSSLKQTWKHKRIRTWSRAFFITTGTQNKGEWKTGFMLNGQRTQRMVACEWKESECTANGETNYSRCSATFLCSRFRLQSRQMVGAQTEFNIFRLKLFSSAVSLALSQRTTNNLDEDSIKAKHLQASRNNETLHKPLSVGFRNVIMVF